MGMLGSAENAFLLEDCAEKTVMQPGADPGFLVTIAQIFWDRNHALLACGTRPLYGQMINHVCL